MDTETNTNDTLPLEPTNDSNALDEIKLAIEKEEERLRNPAPAEEEVTENQEKKEEKEKPEEEQEEIITKGEQDNQEEEVAPKKEKKDDKLWKIKKDKYKILAEKDALEQENRQLKEMLNESLNSGAYHYARNAYTDLDKAKLSKKRAIEEGDVDALLEADIELTKAINAVNELEKWQHSESYKSPPPPPKDNSNSLPYNEIQQEILYDWLDNHDNLQPSSKNYDPELANKVIKFANKLDNYLNSNNQSGAIYSEEYFDAIDNYIESINSPPPSPPPPNPSSAHLNSHVGNVRNSYPSSNVKSKTLPDKMVLTADEKIMCANMGLPEAAWLEQKYDLKGKTLNQR